ncbi:hypothetical protein [Pseudomonas poae]|uniref:hypothetical protein n=1 Tax=Pseudomonas poae TaxID=200451 RepID=UPI0034D78F4D
MLTAKVGFVMSSVGFLRVGDSSAGRRLLRPVKPDMRGIVQNALPQNASIANCNQKAPQSKLKLLILLKINIGTASAISSLRKVLHGHPITNWQSNRRRT